MYPLKRRTCHKLIFKLPVEEALKQNKEIYVNRASNECSFFKWAIPSLFPFIVVFSIQLTVNNVQYKFLTMTGFKPQTSGIGSDRSTN